MATIAVIEDERELAALLRTHLENAGHTVLLAFDGPSGVALVERERPDLIVLDLMLPGFDGLEVCRRVRRTMVTPILMLTAKSTELDKVVGLELGADDYVTKPFSPRELVARVNAILRRVELVREHSRTREGDEPIVYPDLRIDPVTREVVSGGRPVHLTAKEFELLRLLAANPGRVFSREYLLDRVWGSDYEGLERTVDTHIARLRRKLGGPGSPGDRITTLWGVGYRFERREGEP
ncbi:response regulator transcription factor [Thermomicrobiaceae bacterium CFH 74404]|uniref:Phosphate regulon transcriptional regulatory protein PhoB n=1 Tax=Thermalbibacter longus TaxID=2951981 RepID=A0AA41WC73_9BACT|nr:response regulator transcription factor [Thermalbibacter longus]MCM8747759.1 response regulator transcription factor [Thermalbibacter longus]